MQKAKEYFENNYGKGHIESVTEMKDFISLYALIEEYAQEQVKLFAIPDVINWAAVNERLPNRKTLCLTIDETDDYYIQYWKGYWETEYPVKENDVMYWVEIKPPCL